jgi:dTDP-4-dehydrorhamnose 3,5-epimerase
MKIAELAINGCYLVELSVFEDTRGKFVKTYNQEQFVDTPLSTFNLKEEFYTISKKNVLRGLHFQSPPASHSKIVTCIKGAALDFFLDLRKSSETYGKLLTIELTEDKPNLLYLPVGIAHGFLSLCDDTILHYKTDHVYSPKDDQGILWSSVGLDLNGNDVIVSDRDSSFPEFKDFVSYF